MEKLKDFIYDHTDLLLSLLVLSAIVFIIGANFTFFDQDLSSFISSSDNGSSSNNETLIEEGPTGPEEETEKDDLEKEGAQDEQDPDNEEIMDTVTVQIPQGATASAVGDVLYEHNLVESSSTFVETSENLNVSHRLRPGTFQIPKDASLEQIIQILIQSSL